MMDVKCIELNSLEGLKFDESKELHRSNENVCYLGKLQEKQVVVKRLILRRPDSLDKFEEEAALLNRKQLKHAIVQPLAIVRAPPHYSIVLPYMEKGDLKQLIDEANAGLSVEMTLSLAVDIAESMQIIHEQGIVHRDFKTANVLVDKEFNALLSDFGSARVLKTNQQQTSQSGTYQPSGGFHKTVIDGTTLGYTSPEVLRNKEATQASDIYGIGIVLSEMITGLGPYEGAEKETADMHTILDASYSEHALIVAITHEHLRPNLVGYEEKGFPIDLLMLVRRCWNADPGQRPSAAEVYTELKGICAKVNLDLNNANRSKFHTVSISSADCTTCSIQNDSSVETSQALDDAMEVTPHRADDVASVAVELDNGDLKDGTRLEGNQHLKCGAFATSGRRGKDKMEDRHSLRHVSFKKHNNVTIASVFDGHGGDACSEYANQKLPVLLEDVYLQYLNDKIDKRKRNKLLENSFVEVDKKFRALEAGSGVEKHSGTTAISAGFWWNVEEKKVYCVVTNVGDCRAIVCQRRNGVDCAKALSNDHNADVVEEQTRIERAGGRIVKTVDGRMRVQGHIQVTRSLGDASMKPFGVTAVPEVTEFVLEPSVDEFVIIATDGVFDTLSNEQAIKAVRDTAKDPGLAAKRVCGEALANGSGDNISCVVVFLKRFDAVDKIF